MLVRGEEELIFLSQLAILSTYLPEYPPPTPSASAPLFIIVIFRIIHHLAQQIEGITYHFGFVHPPHSPINKVQPLSRAQHTRIIHLYLLNQGFAINDGLARQNFHTLRSGWFRAKDYF